MKLEEVEMEAKALSQRELEILVSRLVDSLQSPPTDVSDEEVDKRVKELDNGTEAELSHEEFVRRLRRL